MKVVKVKELEDCFDGTFMKEVLLSKAISRNFIYYIGSIGELQYFPDFAKPFFRVDIPGKCIIKGIENNKTIRLILERKNINQSLDYLIKYVEKYKGGN